MKISSCKIIFSKNDNYREDIVRCVKQEREGGDLVLEKREESIRYWSAGSTPCFYLIVNHVSL